jgi:glutamate synthase (NADPH/NADH) large chain/glutamate synthase (ferredoxin)
VVNYFFFVAEEARQIMAQLGIRRFDDLIGRADLLDTRKGVEHWKARGLDFSRMLPPAARAGRTCPASRSRSRTTAWTRRWTTSSSSTAAPAIERGREGAVHRGGAQRQPLGGRDALGRAGAPPCPEGLPDDTIRIQLEGTGGQSVRRLPAPRASRCT